MKKWKLLLICASCVCLSAFAFSGCGGGGKNQTPAEEQKSEGSEAQAEKEKKAESVELVDGMYIYTNEEFKFSMAFPGDWDAPKGEVDEDGDLNVDVSSKDEMEYIFAIMGKIDPAAPTPADFEKQLISQLEEELGKVKQEREEKTINGVEFIKSKIEIESEDIVQVTYIAYVNKMYYAITFMGLENGEIVQSKIEEIEKSIKIQQ